jgi:cell division protein FtsX
MQARRAGPPATVLAVLIAGLLGAGTGALTAGRPGRSVLASASTCPTSATVIFLRLAITSAETARVETLLERQPGIVTLRFASQGDDFAEFTTLFPRQSGVDEHQVPASLRFVSDTPSDGDQAEAAVEPLPGVWTAELIHPAQDAAPPGTYFDTNDLMRKAGPPGARCRHGAPAESVALQRP